MTRLTTALAALLAVALAGCATTNTSNGKQANAGPAKPAAPLAKGLDPAASPDPFPSTYRVLPGRPTAIVGANVFDGAGRLIEGGVVLMRDGKIEQVGAGLAVPAGYESLDGRGKWVTPGFI